MRRNALALFGAVGLGLVAISANAAPLAPTPLASDTSNIVQVAQGCGPEHHRTHHGYCVWNHHSHAYHGSYHHYRPYYGYYRTYPYYGGGYEPWNRPSPSDHIAN